MTDAVFAAAPRPDEGRQFHFRMALAIAAVALLGFAPTYWKGMAEGSLTAHPVIHLHATIFYAWTALFAVQTWLVATGRTARHRALGLAGISLATLVVVMGILAAMDTMRRGALMGLATEAQAFAIVPLASILFFAVCFGLAIRDITRPAQHRRWMMLATISMLDAPIARWFMVAFAPPDAKVPPVAVDLPPSIVAALLLVICLVADQRRTGRVQPIYAGGLAAYLGMKLIQIPVSGTSAWLAVTQGLLALKGA